MDEKQQLTQAGIAAVLAEKTGLTKEAAGDCLTALLSVLRDALKHGQRIEMRGFGAFELAYREGRNSRNPQTGETVRIAGRRAVKFRPGKELKAIR